MIPGGLPLRTPRLRLRTIEALDVEGPYATWFSDPLVTQYLETTGPQPPLALAAFIARCNASDREMLLGICRAEDGTHIGNIKLGPIVLRHGRAGIGIMIGDRASWGRGFAREAIAAVADFAFSRLGLEKLIAGCYAPNIGVRRAFAAAGFHEEATRRRHARLADGNWVDVIELARFRNGAT